MAVTVNNEAVLKTALGKRLKTDMAKLKTGTRNVVNHANDVASKNVSMKGVGEKRAPKKEEPKSESRWPTLRRQFPPRKRVREGFELDSGPSPGIQSNSQNSVRILSRVAEGRALRRHSNRSTIAVDAGANSCPAVLTVFVG